MKTLVVIDMQIGLLAPSIKTNPIGIASVVKNISDLMYEFKYQQWPIMMVQFVQYETPIISELISIVKNYNCWQLVNKDRVDGSDAVLSKQQYWKWPTNFTVCGIYGDECVAETVNGIIHKEPNAHVEVMIEAIYPNYNTWGISKDLHAKQTKIVKQGDWNVNTFV